MHNIVPVNLYSSSNVTGVSRHSNVYPILTDLGQPIFRNIGAVANNAILLTNVVDNSAGCLPRQYVANSLSQKFSSESCFNQSRNKIVIHLSVLMGDFQ